MVPIKETMIISVYKLWFIQGDSKEMLCDQPTDRLIMGQILHHHNNAVLFNIIMSNDPTKTMIPATDKKKEK